MACRIVVCRAHNALFRKYYGHDGVYLFRTRLSAEPFAETMGPAMPLKCRLCGQAIVTPALPLGHVPVCNGFGKVAAADRVINLDVAACETCGLIQLGDAPAPAMLVPQQPWIRYREPEAHLDTVVADVLSRRPNARRALGTGPFEQPLLSRLAGRGLQTEALTLDTAPAAGRYPYLETWQATLTEAHLAQKATELGTFDLLSCRYIVEHTPEPVRALEALKQLLSPDGLLLIEVPDSSKFLAAKDYCFLWEEHSCYFTEDTLRRLGEAAGYSVVALLRYPGALEDALVAVLERAHSAVPAPAALGASSLFQAYLEGFAPARSALQAKLARAAGPKHDRVALFGIGHHAIMFVNAFGLGENIALAVDDDPDKAGFFPPGFRVPVVSSEALLANKQIMTCLFAVAPHIQAKVEAKLKPLAQRGVEFRSIYAALENSIMKDLV
jgi:SAM-dependent methyltransferase